ncbi:MAG: hypothetical protein JWR37_795 [Mycobacterium sp.]|nr:hypothetical protein [Mycobacterium sp.]
MLDTRPKTQFFSIDNQATTGLRPVRFHIDRDITCRREPAVQTVDEALRLMQVSPQRGLLPVVLSSTAYRHAMSAALRCFELPRYLGDLLV